MDKWSSGGWFVLATVATILVPILFPVWFALYLRRTRKLRKTVVGFGIFYELIWLSAIISSVIPMAQSEIDVPSNTASYGDVIASYEEKSDSYVRDFYTRLKQSQVVSEEPDNESKTTVTGGSSLVAAENKSTNVKTKTESAPAEDAAVQQVPADSMSGITIAEADGSPYRRKDWGSGWNIGQGCNIRQRLLAEQSKVQVRYGDPENGCLVTYGVWDDLYSYRVLEGNPYQGDGEENDLDVDHIIPLSYVNSHGGYAWSHDRKVSYGKSLEAKNNGVYVAVSSTENRKKGDKGPADYYPANKNFYCEYSIRWRNIARIYGISLSRRDYDKVKRVLAECGVN